MNRNRPAPYLPNKENDQYLWLVQFDNACQTFKGRLTTALNTANLAILREYREKSIPELRTYELNTHNYSKELTKLTNAVFYGDPNKKVTFPVPVNLGPTAVQERREGCFPWIVKTLVPAIKADPNYNSVMDADFGLLPIPHADNSGQPEYHAYIKDNQLEVSFTKGEFEYFTLKVAHGGEHFDLEQAVLHSPWRDSTPLPEKEPAIWRVQLFGYRKGETNPIPGDIIDVAAKAYTAEHAEGAR